MVSCHSFKRQASRLLLGTGLLSARRGDRLAGLIAIFRERNSIVRLFCKLKHFRRVATRYHKLGANLLV